MILDGTLYLIGAAVVLKSLYDFAYFVTLYLSAPSVHRYLHGKAPYALITGATDGIGKATAKELYKRGFNIILHGRNPDKLRQVEEELSKLGNKDVKLWVEDACRDSIDFGTAVAQWEGLEITLVVHNVGGVVVRAERIDQVPEDVVRNELKLNATFPLLLSRAVLPKLRAAAASGPTGMVFLSTLARTHDLLRLIPYAPSKAFLIRLSGCLGLDERFWAPTRVETCAVVVGSVVSAGHRVAGGFFSPSAERYAGVLVDRFGCGRAVVTPYWPHAVQNWVIGLLPKRMFERAVSQTIREEIEAAKKA
ncbi:hypothetical protein EIP86_006973 [Pleurotus ostreatoroseus]|nr:hypothetical protein EIP86_006973 [Pleurotus ostreatoroseus]